MNFVKFTVSKHIQHSRALGPLPDRRARSFVPACSLIVGIAATNNKY